MSRYITAICTIAVLSCQFGPETGLQIIPGDKITGLQHTATDSTAMPGLTPYDTAYQVIHVFVSLCDNKYQGIVPVPAKIGNGQDPSGNLYWVGYGVKSYFKSSPEWKLVETRKIDTLILERVIFKHVSKKWYLVADAYNGKYIKNCTHDFLNACAGIEKDTLHLKERIIGKNGNATLAAYIGHDGLMDFELQNKYACADGKTRDCIILACFSKRYFGDYVKNAKANPVLWTSNLMGPEAYTLHDAITGYIANETNEQIQARAAAAYAKYTKCSVKAAKGLLIYGW